MTAAGSITPRIAPPDWVEMVARHDPGRRCFVRPDGEVVTYGEARSAVRRLADALAGRGITQGSTVAILGTDSPEYLFTVLATMRLGAVVAPLNFRVSEPELAAMVGVLDPAAVVRSARYAGILRRACPGGPAALTVSLDPGAGRESVDPDPSVADLIAEGRDVERPTLTSDDDILAVILTSGTTGTPKGVLQSQRMIKAVTNKGIVEQSFRSDDLFYSGAPLFHAAGLGYAYYSLARGAANVLLPQFDAAQVLPWLTDGGVSRCMFVPSMVLSLLELIGATKPVFPHLRSIMYGGAPMPRSVVAQMVAAFRCDLYNGFGAGTEAGGQSILTPDDHLRAVTDSPHLLGSIGKAMYGVDLKLGDDDGREVRPGTIGEIWARADTIMSGYLDRTRPAANVVGGWFHGGDMAHRDDDGYLFLAGRKDDMILRGGENVYPFEIESVLHEHPGVADAAVVGIPDPYWGEAVVAVVVPAPGTDLDPEDLPAFCRARLAGYKVPRSFHLVAELPRNSTGKTDKLRLKAVLTGPAGPDSEPPERSLHA